MSEPKLKLIIKFKMHSATFTCILLPYEQKSVRCQSYMYFILDYNFYTCTYHMVKSAYKPSQAHQAGAYPGFCSMKQLGVFLYYPLDEMLVHCRVTELSVLTLRPLCLHTFNGLMLLFLEIINITGRIYKI